MTHELKCWPRYYEAILWNHRTFELRKNDRSFQTGDTLRLREWDPETKEYTGRHTERRVIHILHADECGIKGLQPGYCIMSLESVA